MPSGKLPGRPGKRPRSATPTACVPDPNCLPRRGRVAYTALLLPGGGMNAGMPQHLVRHPGTVRVGYRSAVLGGAVGGRETGYPATGPTGLIVPPGPSAVKVTSPLGCGTM